MKRLILLVGAISLVLGGVLGKRMVVRGELTGLRQNLRQVTSATGTITYTAIERIYSNEELFAQQQKRLEDINILLSKYAKLYDACRFK